MILRRLPAHLRADREFLKLLRKEADGVRGLYGVPVWLTGSALLDFNARPRDWDFRLEMPDKDFTRRFGSVAEWKRQGSDGGWGSVRWRWSDECVKRSKDLTARLRRQWAWVDFQIYPASYCKDLGYNKHPKLRLDTRAQP